MERSVLGSAVKTYGGKNRYSRSSSYSYRPSGLIGSNQNIFDDDDPITPFDRLLHEDKTKNTFVQATPLKSTYNGTINTIKTKKFQLHADSRSNALKSVQNVRIDSVSILKSSTVYKFYGSSKSYENKENTVKCKNQLFFSDSDSSGSDVFDYSKTVGKKAATTAKKQKKKDFGLKNASRAINQSDKRKRRLEYRERCKNQSSKNSSSSKCSFVNLNADGYGIPIRRRTLVVDRKSLLSFAKPLDEETGETENITDSFKSMFEGIRKYAEKLENSDQSASIAKNSASNPVDTNSATIENSDQSASVAKNSASNPVNTNSATNPGVSLSPTPIRDSFIIDFRPVQISTPRQSAKYDLKIQARSPIHCNSLGDRQSNELDPTNLSKSLQSIKNRLSDRCKEIALCEVFEKSCSLSTKLSETVAVEKVEQSSETPCEIVNSNGSSDVRVEKVNVSGETNCSEVSMDAKNSSESDIEIFSANNSLEETEKNDETESHYMSVESSSIADHSNDVTVEMKSPELFNSDANSTREISRELFRPRAGDSHTSSYLSDSADEKYATVIERAEVTKSTGSETNRNSGYVDSLLFSVLNPSIKSSFGSGSSRSSTASNLPFTELSCTRTSVSSPSYSRSGVENASVCSFVSHHLRDKLSPAKSSCPLSSSRVGFESESNCSSTESFVSPVVSSKTSSSSDSSSSDELLLTMREKTPTSNTLVNDGLSPGFAGFETSPATVAKLAEFKGIVGEVLTPNLSSGLSPISGHSLSNDSGIGEARLVERLSLRSMEQNAMSYSRRRSSGILRKDTSTRLRKSVRFDSVSKFETLPEEKAEDSAEMDEKADSVKPEIVPHNPENKVHFTERRRKRCPLPTLSEADTETDEGFGGSQNSILSCISSVREDNQTLVRSPIFLAKGKKWRRSFLMLKNVRDRGFNPDLSEEENKGRCWRQNMEQLIQSQSESTMLHRELDECTVLRTGFDGKTTSGFEEGDTLTEKSIYSRRSRFSLSISVDRSLRHEISHHNSILEESSLARLALESRESCLTDINVSAGDHFRNRSLPQIDFGASHTARDIVLLYCQQSQPLPFDECFDESVLRSCRKIGEGVYGEVFSLKTRSKSSVIKIIPIEGDQKVNGERQKRFDEILSELVISLELSNLRKREDYYTNCFAEVQRCWCVQGRYPTRLISLWKEYDQTKGSDNDSPKIFRDDQLYIILELNNGGEDLESFEFNNAQQTLSVFKQVANALAVAEQAFKFEHRDLHWGNVLVSPTKDRESTFIFGDKTRNVQLFGVKVTIIDYTLSRISVNNHTLYNNIGEDPDLFTAEGDFQFEVYRLMRKEVDDTWDRYVPKTNLLWLYYLIDKMINEVRYRRDYTKIHQTNVGKLRRLHASVLDFESSCDLVENQAI